MGNDALIFGFLVLYKVACLVVGLGIAVMGFRLFSDGLLKATGSIEASIGPLKVVLTKAAPGIVFSVLGSFVIYFATFKDVEFASRADGTLAVSDKSGSLLPDKPPFEPK